MSAYTMGDGVMMPNDGTPASIPSPMAKARGGSGGGQEMGKKGASSFTAIAFSPEFEQRAAAAEAMASSLAAELSSIMDTNAAVRAPHAYSTHRSCTHRLFCEHRSAC